MLVTEALIGISLKHPGKTKKGGGGNGDSRGCNGPHVGDGGVRCIAISSDVVAWIVTSGRSDRL